MVNWTFGDGFDLYSATTDLIAGYWENVGTNMTNVSFQTGRYSGSRAIRCDTGSPTVAQMQKTSGSNDALHHINVALWVANTLTGTNTNHWFTFYDGATAQCTVFFRSDGAIVLTSGASNGTVQATYTGAILSALVWNSFEIEVNISNTGGYMNVRKNGSLSNDFTSATNLNTRAGTTNNYANRLAMGSISTSNNNIDDFLWRSDATTVPWLGDVRCQARRPASDAAVQWSRVGTRTSSFAGGGGVSGVANRVFYTGYTIAVGGTVPSATVNIGSTYTGNIKCALFNDNGSGSPGTVIASATNILTNPTTGTQTFTFSSPSVTTGQKVWLAFCEDTAGGTPFTSSATSTSWYGSTTYASFPVANPTGLTAMAELNSTLTVAPSGNWGYLNEAQQDLGATYVIDSVVGHSDLYGISTLSSTPPSVVAVTTRAFLEKADAGGGSITVQLKSGAATTWNPADIAFSALSGGNLVLTQTNTPGGGRANTSITSGKYYFETMASPWASASPGLGLSSVSLVGSESQAGLAATGRTSGIWINGSSTGVSLGIMGSGTTVGIAVDRTANLIWFRIAPAGNWNNSGTANPATGAGGLSISAIVGALYPIVVSGSNTDATTANFGASSFVGTPPAGFASFPGATTVQAPALGGLPVGSWLWAWRTDVTDPNTGSAWTPSAVDAAQIGPIITA